MSGGEYIRHDAPSDVSHDYMLHNEAEDRCIEPTGRTKENVVIWRQRAKRNDLFVCECYIAMLMEIGGFIGEFAGEQIQPEEERKSE